MPDQDRMPEQPAAGPLVYGVHAKLNRGRRIGRRLTCQNSPLRLMEPPLLPATMDGLTVTPCFFSSLRKI